MLETCVMFVAISCSNLSTSSQILAASHRIQPAPSQHVVIDIWNGPRAFWGLPRLPRASMATHIKKCNQGGPCKTHIKKCSHGGLWIWIELIWNELKLNWIQLFENLFKLSTIFTPKSYFQTHSGPQSVLTCSNFEQPEAEMAGSNLVFIGPV